MKSRLLQVSIGNQLLFASKEQKLQQTRVREGQDNLKMSLLATSYRFEIQTGNAKAHKKAMERQEAFIKVSNVLILYYCLFLRSLHVYNTSISALLREEAKSFS